MTSLAERTIAALRTNHDVLAALVPTLSAEQLNGPSGASEWPVAQVLSHLGSGAEITLAGFSAALNGTPAPEQSFNESVWDRWNAASPQEQAEWFLEHNAALVETLEALPAEVRESLEIKLGFLPAPIPLAAAAGMRLNEAAQHSWDVRVAFDPTATLAEDAAAVLAEQFGGTLNFLLGFTSKADALTVPAVVAIGDTGYGLEITDTVAATPAVADPTATFDGPLEAALRLISGRLGPDYTPEGLTVTGNVSLDDLRRVFPGF
ncbi:maleylpyruvate isomerase family mycothiol-dependent enzyme [Jatrophihabitans sp.]|uniref:maleylpyruvate isomerase family mycothiol-dependent enzyme n=1 Tax=Jatrophihabitans sp. TaxID=1932789 RepID=UPI0030C6D819|nr:hypothetical protein [Jatrophihabitans sp.]